MFKAINCIVLCELPRIFIKAYELQDTSSETLFLTIRSLKYQRLINYEHTKLSLLANDDFLYLRL